VTTMLWVIVPAYNEAARIGGTLAALAGQTDRDFTLCVVDNASTDETGAIVRRFAAEAPFPVHLVREREKGVGCAVDTGFRYAIEHGAAHLARTDADCLPHPGWVAAARAALVAGADMVCGKIVARRDEHGPAGRAAFRCLVGIAAAFGRLRPVHRSIDRRDDGDGAPDGGGLDGGGLDGGGRDGGGRDGGGPVSGGLVGGGPASGGIGPGAMGSGAGGSDAQGYLAPYRMHAGNNMAITAAGYLGVGGMPRMPSPTDRTFLNRVRRHTAAIVRRRDMVVENSTRRLRAYGVLGTARWYLDRGSDGRTADPR
jgi:glycosyltransferase involved in cell wall biosynthesis